MKWLPQSLAARLFVLYGLALSVFFAGGVAAFWRYEFGDQLEQAQQAAGMLVDLAGQAVEESALIGDYDTVKRTLQKTVLRTPFREAMFIDMAGGRITVRDETPRLDDPPQWLRQKIAARLYDVNRNIVVGGQDYGVMRLVFDIDQVAQRLWEMALDVLAISAACLSAALLITHVLLRRWLRNFERLQAFERRIASGEVDAEAVPLSDAPAEIRQAIDVINRTAASLRGQFGQRIDSLMSALVQHKSAMDEAAIVCELDIAGRIAYVNDLFVESCGYTRDELVGRRLDELGLAPALAADGWRPLDQVWHGELATPRREGGAVWRKRTIMPIFDPAGAVEKYICIDIDFTHEKDVEARLQAQMSFGQQALDRSDVDELLVQAANVAMKGLGLEWCRVLKLHTDGVSLTAMSDARFPGDRLGFPIERGESEGHYAFALASREPVVIEDLRLEQRFKSSAALAAHGIVSAVEVPIVSAQGTFGLLAVYCPERRHFTPENINFLRSLANTLATAIDRQKADQRFAYLAQFDSLTGLPNRNLFRDRFSQTLSLAQRNKWQVGVMFLDLDRFKSINDSMGHSAGDRLLNQVAQRLQACVRSSDTVARLGGDEFALVLSNMAKADDACVVAKKVVAALADPFDLEGQTVYVSASLGISIFPGDGSTADVLLKNADTAMYRAKERGRNNYQFYLPEMNARAVERLKIETELRGALERDEFRLHYQPKINLTTGNISGLEALLRWQHPERGLVPPLHFIPILEETGLIVPVGQWIVRSVCEQLKSWQRVGINPPPVAVNVSARQFQQKDLDEMIGSILTATGIDAGLLEFELTESMLMSDPDEAVRAMHNMKRRGVRLSLDDFGTGYSSLSHLKRFPLDALKIDRSFVRDVTSDPDDAALVLAIISLAHNLGLKVVGEGVEDEVQLSFLSAHGCDELQGYYFSPPLAIEDCTRVLAEGRRLRAPGSEAAAKPAVLLVDDDGECMEVLKRALKQDGYEVDTVLDARAGLEALARNAHPIVISDQVMPSMSGVDFLARVRQLYPDSVRILLTGQDHGGILPDAVNKAGVHKYLSKSWNAARKGTEIRDAYRRYGRAGRPSGGALKSARAA